ncbi:MAG: hypothetical protein L3J16_02035 [Anaerolineales bacterium]|nr:hypothetical protein [Anaerolineales bacterium]
MISLLLAGTLALLYGAQIALTAIKQMRQQNLPTGAAALMGLVGLVIMFSSIFIPFRMMGALYILIIGLIAMHLLAIRNGIKLYGKINPKHHIVRFIISLAIVLLAFFGLYSSPTF